ncbi:MAG: alanine--tRNA ligase [Candidatus Bathyarchaeota archaeon]|nr:MAG: alanine--tRNA ligase [Candidatus Bathyarchaeota archaeon]
MRKKRFPKKEYHVPFFDEEDYVRKLCPKCREHFWTQIQDMETCGEATPEGCASYTFINRPPTRKPYSLKEMRETFLSFFEKRGHARMKPYPVVARWRDDLYLTSASIVDFQPYVTNGIVPPPANPLVISQPCIRLVDIDNTGPTFGRHLTIFEMGGHHAFNYPDSAVYWKDATVRYHHEFVTKELGIPSKEVIYKEDVWSGGGNAGPDLETIVRGLELATLVFMKFKVFDGEFVELPIRTVDTGYGMERYAWISQGVISGFHAIYGPILDRIFQMADIDHVDFKLLAEVAKLSGTFGKSLRGSSQRKVAEHVGLKAHELAEILLPIENAFAVADHTKSLSFMLAEGVVPSNVQEGYLTRLMIRRTYRLLKALGIENRLDEIIDLQIREWGKDFPHLEDMQNEIIEMLLVEQQKFEDTLKRGAQLVERIVNDLKRKGKKRIPTETLVELYDSHGLPPEVVRDSAEKEGVQVKKTEDFYKMVAERHLEAPQKTVLVDERANLVADLPETRMLYYEDAYLTEFHSRVLRVLDRNQVVLEQTNFYPEGGGQPGDTGFLEFDGRKSKVVDAQKVGKVIIHILKNGAPQEGILVKGSIDWQRRSYLMRAHTATHLVMGAARRVLGQHVWQTGTQKNVEQARLDISHYRRLTPQETDKIEALANQAVIDMIPVVTEWLPRDEAEASYGFRLYQGGAVPGKKIRVVKVDDWEVEACAGTHIKNTGEVGFIKILHTARIQDGVERLVYSTGRYAVEASQRNGKLLRKLSETLDAPLEKLLPTTKRLLREWKEMRREKERLQKTLAAKGATSLQPQKISEFNVLIGTVDWISDEQGLISTSNEFVKTGANTIAVVGGVIGDNARIAISVGRNAIDIGVTASEIASASGALLGGGGSGTRSFAQAGGPQKSRLHEALSRAEEDLKIKLMKKPK